MEQAQGSNFTFEGEKPKEKLYLVKKPTETEWKVF